MNQKRRNFAAFSFAYKFDKIKHLHKSILSKINY